MANGKQTKRRGGAIVEFALATALMFVPILAGLGTVGFSLVRGMEASSLNSSAGQMFSSGIDFTQSSNQSILTMLAGNLNLGTDSEVILSQIQNNGSGAVCTQQIIVGNSALGSSRYVSVDGGGNLTVGGNFTLPLNTGQTVFVSETYVNNTLFAFNSTGATIYMMNFF